MPDVKPSPELEAVTRRFMATLGAGNAEARVGLFSEDPALLYIGTAVREVWNADMLHKGYAAYAQAVPEADVRDVRVSAHECGDVGWATWTGVFSFANSDRDIPFRATLVFLMERGSWKIVQVHNSTPTENVENLGFDYSVLDELVDAARALAETGWSGITTIMFTDIADSSALAAAMGDARWTARVAAHFEEARQLIGAHDGRLVKSLGDGTMSCFFSASAAMAVARALQRSAAADTAEPRLRLRVGLHTGEVQQKTDDFFGTVVNKAARIAATSGPGEIRVSDTARLMVGADGGFTFADPLNVVLRGLDGEHLVYRLEWQE